MKSLAWSCIAIGLLGLSPQSSKADFLFDFTFSGGGIQGLGILDAISNGDGSFTAVSGSAFVIGAPESGALTLFKNPAGTGPSISPSGFFIYDNQLFPAKNPTLDIDGLLFRFANGKEVNIWGTGPSAYTYEDNTGFTRTNITFSLLAVPEPSSLSMVAIAIGPGLGFWWRRRKSMAIA